MGKKNFSYKRKKKRRGGSAMQPVGEMPHIEKKMNDVMSSFQSMNKSPMSHVIDYLLYTLYSLAGIFIYYPSFLINLPDTTLEQLVPTKEGCKTLFGDELICKRKLRCFFRKCSLLEDPIGYKLQKELDKEQNRGKKKKRTESRKIQKIQLGGNKQKRTLRRHKYMNYLPSKVRKIIERSHKKELKQFYDLIKNLLKDAKKKGGGSSVIQDAAKGELQRLGLNQSSANFVSNVGKNVMNGMMNDPSDYVNQSNCVNQVKHPDGTKKTNYILCNAKPIVEYEPGSGILSILNGRTRSEQQSIVLDTLHNRMDQLAAVKKSLTGGSLSNMGKEIAKDENVRTALDKLGKKGVDMAKNSAGKQGMDMSKMAEMAQNVSGQSGVDMAQLAQNATGKQGMDMSKLAEMAQNVSGQSGVDMAQLAQNATGKQGMDMLKNLSDQSGMDMSKLAEMAQNATGKQGMDMAQNVESSIDQNELIEQILKESLDHEALFKLLMAYKMLDQTFREEVSDSEVVTYEQNLPDQMYGVDVSFPWHTKDPFTTPEERRKCLFAHLTKSNLGDDYKTKDLYEKCFVCKNCTLANTSFKAWDKFISNLFTSSKMEFSSISHDLFELMKKNYDFSLYSIKQYYLFSLLSMYFIHPLLNPQKINIIIDTKDGKKIPLKDLIMGIPQIKSSVSPSSSVQEKLRQTYLTFKIMNLENILYKLCYETMYKRILKEHDIHIEKRLYEIKKQIAKTSQLFYGRQRLYNFIDNTIDLQGMKQYLPFEVNDTLKMMNTNQDAYNENEITQEFEKEFNKYIPLFQVLLDPSQYDDPSQYETNSDEIVQSFKSIVEKVNQKDQ